MAGVAILLLARHISSYSHSMTRSLQTRTKQRRRHAKKKEKEQALGWQARTRATVNQTVEHFDKLWNKEVHISARSLRRWRGKLYGGIEMSSTISTQATTISACNLPIHEFEPRSIFEEEENELATELAPLNSNLTARSRRVDIAPGLCTRGQRYIKPPTAKALADSKNAEDNAYWVMYKHHRRWTRERYRQGKVAPPMDRALKCVLMKKFNISLY